MALLLNREHLRPGDRLCVGVSGGADSVALLLTVHGAKEALGVGLTAAHVHHGLRGVEADDDLTFVQALCDRLDVPLHVERASVPNRVQETGESTEEAARNVRYAFFEALLSSGEATAVLTAHTLDDQAETVLLKLLRGAWTEGLSAIYPVVALKAGRILRPLLDVRRAEIEAFLVAAGQTWRTDSTNAEVVYTRNRVRHQLMPLLRDFNPVIDQALANLSGLARDDEAHWQRAIGQLLPQILLPGKPVRGGGRAVSTAAGQASEVAIELERLRALDLATRRRVLRGAARQIGTRLTFDETGRLMAMLLAGGPASLHLPDGLRAQRSARELRLSRQESATK